MQTPLPVGYRSLQLSHQPLPHRAAVSANPLRTMAMANYATDAEGVAILPLSSEGAEESDASEVVHAFGALGPAVGATPPTGPAAPPPTPTMTMAAAGLTAAVPPPELQGEEAPLGDAGWLPTPADLEQHGAPHDAAMGYASPVVQAVGGHAAGSGAADTASGIAPTTSYIPYVSHPPPPPSA